MVDHFSSFHAGPPQAARRSLPLTESAGARTILITIALGFLLLFLLLPLVVVFAVLWLVLPRREHRRHG